MESLPAIDTVPIRDLLVAELILTTQAYRMLGRMKMDLWPDKRESMYSTVGTHLRLGLHSTRAQRVRDSDLHRTVFRAARVPPASGAFSLKAASPYLQ